MPIPDYQSTMLPLLKFSQDQQEHSIREAIESLADEFNLSEEERGELLPSGTQPIFDNRVGWARTYMKKAGLLDATRRGHFRITERELGKHDAACSKVRCLTTRIFLPDSFMDWFFLKASVYLRAFLKTS